MPNIYLIDYDRRIRNNLNELDYSYVIRQLSLVLNMYAADRNRWLSKRFSKKTYFSEEKTNRNICAASIIVNAISNEAMSLLDKHNVIVHQRRSFSKGKGQQLIDYYLEFIKMNPGLSHESGLQRIYQHTNIERLCQSYTVGNAFDISTYSTHDILIHNTSASEIYRNCHVSGRGNCVHCADNVSYFIQNGACREQRWNYHFPKIASGDNDQDGLSVSQAIAQMQANNVYTISGDYKHHSFGHKFNMLFIGGRQVIIIDTHNKDQFSLAARSPREYLNRFIEDSFTID
ncbi:hypothetical protein [Dongshaea marina]|uniref:hypothetical protein n=1 Tax=Dongshaea marina TaxID=2047966 RepID=UPI000D3ED11F|nr:hypothetical protein [Dongshaea marina]